MQDERINHSSDSGVTNGHQQQTWERELLTRLAMATLNEQRRARRWRIFFILLGFVYFGLLLILLGRVGVEEGAQQGPHTAVVDVTGIIAPESTANAEDIIDSLNKAFENEDTVGVILRINSPGGSPVQAGYIYDEMVRLRNKYPHIPLYAVIEDMGASGGYYVAAGAEKIYADKASIIGSIGVRMDSFGLVEAIDKLGIERRLMTAGSNKALLDPFLPEDESTRQHVQNMLDSIHQQFINAVKSQRGDRLVANEDLFSGLIWTGEKSISLGLVDALGSVNYVAREVVGEETLRDYTHQGGFFDRLSQGMGAMLLGVLNRSTRARLE